MFKRITNARRFVRRNKARFFLYTTLIATAFALKYKKRSEVLQDDIDAGVKILNDLTRQIKDIK